MTATTKLGDLISILGGGTPSRTRADYYNGDIPWVTVKDLKDELTLSSSQERITKLGLENSASRLVPAGNVIVATRMAVGKAVRTLADVAINQDLKALVCGQRIDSRFLLFFLRSKASLLEAKASGSTVKGILIEDLQELELVLPPMLEQQRLAARLEQTDRLCRTRRYALELTDAFLPAAFLEIFGDPNSNPKKWPTCRLADVLLSAQDGPHVSPEYCVQGVPFLSTRNIRPGELVWDDLKYISAADAQAQWRKVKPEIGDILYTKGGTTGMAKTVDFEKEVAVWVHIAVLKLRKDTVVPVWLENMLNSRFCYQQSQELTFGIVNRDLGLKRMPHIRMYLPPLPMQQKFAALVERVNSLRAVQREALRQAEHLFASLLDSAFNG
jgi:type I restriction enzyme, S subunit